MKTPVEAATVIVTTSSEGAPLPPEAWAEGGAPERVAARPEAQPPREVAPSHMPGMELEDGPRYLYGVVRAVGDLDFGPIGLGVPPADVHAVREGDLAALVSIAPALVVDPTRAHLLVHQRVTEAVLREHTLLPVAFGTVLRSEAQVRELLRTAHGALSDTLIALEDKVELGLKVLYHREHLARRLELGDATLGRREDEPEAEHEHRISAAITDRVERDMAALLEGLRPLSFASRNSAPVGDRMLLNAAFLVGRDWVESFEAQLKSLAARWDTYAFRFTGPWAPYSFVDLCLGLEPEPDAAA
ncbi:GvpL/GvpF family gas vesicle protein [Pyxidicoccus sp. MSG2]|uniref:GvpL/GvpF family gas vesicle protein n=1 Tax=Pyxidicoccus sp. MSG2 TaxID=2996790 RepID=UPI00226DADD7|nr:GvpL/GvpF family gas vesicle protein [Pyxidicoccus sp. MSG2]MCY1016253.1 GvpL/GvpF family gas vesicle protein [Pyxidicoccus sp. MSG2]